MKQFLLLLGILAVAAAAQAKQSPRHAEADGVWKPGTASIYHWDSETNDWKFDHTENYSYNDLGQRTKLEYAGEYTEIYEYTPSGQMSSDTLIYSNGNISKGSYTYDEVTGKPTGYTNCNLKDDQWVTTSSEECRITRNEKGNITRTDNYIYGTFETERAEHCVYNYGDDDKINEIIYWVTRGDNEPGDHHAHLSDIVWENTDNQPIVDLMYSIYGWFPSALCNNDNRIKSCTIDDYFGKGATADMKVEYTDNLGSYKGLISVYGTPVYIYEYSVLDENGSYAAYIENTEYSVNGSTITTGDTYVSKTVNKCDSNGNCIESGRETPYYKSKTTYDITYDPTHGYPTEEITMRAENDEEMQKQWRTVYGDYALYAGAVSRRPMPTGR